ncbi:MAG TPA: hypothetical protein VNY73_01535 [Bacteroidia bacterium]|jgi:hypothetical protein|nr:hypothetical protein [Bacteroidia bacterium]
MKNILTSICSILFTLSSYSQQDSAIGPHQGHLVRAGEYHIELLGCNDYMEIYVFDKDMGPIHNYGMTGDVKFYYTGETYLSSPLSYYGNDGFTAKIASTNFIYCRVSLDVFGKFINAKYENECILGGGIKN